MRTLRLALVLGLPPLVLQLARGPEDGAPLVLSRATSLANLSFGLAGVLLVFRILDELFASPSRSGRACCCSTRRAFFAHVTEAAAIGPAAAFFAAALVVAVWWPARFDLHSGRALWLGLLLGLGAAVRPQNGLLLAPPRSQPARGPPAGGGRGPRAPASWLLGAFAAGVLPRCWSEGRVRSVPSRRRLGG